MKNLERGRKNSIRWTGLRNTKGSKSSQKSAESPKFFGCDSKNFYDTEFEAIHMAALARERSGHQNIEAYKCLYCPGYHCGHQR